VTSIYSYLVPVSIVILTSFGISANLALTGDIVQPDWALAFLMANLLAQRNSWPWVLPCTLLHDLVLYWSPMGTFPFAVLAPFLLASSDAQLGPALPQRIAVMLFISMGMLWQGETLTAWILTLILCVPAWYGLTKVYERYV